MRELTAEEKGNLRYGCLFCKERMFWMGPKALGLSFNIYCTECIAGYNVTHAALPWQLIADPCETEYEDLAPVLDGKIDIVTFFKHLDDAIVKSMKEAFDRVNKSSD